jgi:hypothetical protein
MSEELPTMKQLSIIIIGFYVILLACDRVTTKCSLTQNLIKYKQASRIRLYKDQQALHSEANFIDQKACKIGTEFFKKVDMKHRSLLFTIKRKAKRKDNHRQFICKERWLLTKTSDNEYSVLMGRVCPSQIDSIDDSSLLNPQMVDGYICVSDQSQRWIGDMTPESLHSLLAPSIQGPFTKERSLLRWRGTVWSMSDDRHFKPCQTMFEERLMTALQIKQGHRSEKSVCSILENQLMESKIGHIPSLEFTRTWRRDTISVTNHYQLQVIPQIMSYDVKRENLRSRKGLLK